VWLYQHYSLISSCLFDVVNYCEIVIWHVLTVYWAFSRITVMQLVRLTNKKRYWLLAPNNVMMCGLTMVRSSLQSAPPKVRRKHDARLLWSFLTTSSTLTFDLCLWKLALHLLVPWPAEADLRLGRGQVPPDSLVAPSPPDSKASWPFWRDFWGPKMLQNPNPQKIQIPRPPIWCGGGSLCPAKNPTPLSALWVSFLRVSMSNPLRSCQPY